MIEVFYFSAGLLVLIVIFGIWVSRTGKPYSGMLFNIHKLLALGAVVLTAVRLFRLDPLGAFPVIAWLLVGISALAVVGLFATGAVMSIQGEVKPVFRWIHGLSMAAAVITFAAGLLLASG